MTFRDPVVERVCDKFVLRSDVGYKKYGQTLDSERTTGVKDLAAYLNDVQEELMDALLYIEAAKRCLQDEIEEVMIKQSKDNGYKLHYFNDAWNTEVNDSEIL